MKRVVGPAGYTIVETLIFLAVSGVLFASAFALISGKQRKTQFETTVKDFSSKLQSVYSNVASGYYNSPGKIKCTTNNSGINKLEADPSASGSEQGTNSDCIFLGQVLVSPEAGSGDFKIISLAGLRLDAASSKEVTSLAEAKPKLFTDTADTYNLAGADFVSSSVVGDNNYSTMAFIGSFAGYDDINKQLKAGSSHTGIYAIDSRAIEDGGIERALTTTSPAPKQISGDIAYCLTNGDQNAVITLSGGTASYRIGDTSLCS